MSSVCVYVCQWLVLMSLMNRCGTRSLWTPAAAISPKEQTNHPGFQIWAGYSVSLKLEDPSLHRAWVFGDNAALFRYILLQEAVAHSLQTLRINQSSYEMAICIDKEARVLTHSHLLPSVASHLVYTLLCSLYLPLPGSLMKSSSQEF